MAAKQPAKDSGTAAWILNLDDRLGTRPLFRILIAGGGIPLWERATAVYQILIALVRHRAAKSWWSIREAATAGWTRHIGRGKPGNRGLRRVAGVENSGWWQADDIRAVHRCRIALGRLHGPVGRASVTMFCGYRPERGPLPVYVLMDADNRIIDMAFDAGEGRISPGIGRLRPSPAVHRDALVALSMYCGDGLPDEDSIGDFFDVHLRSIPSPGSR